jgi:hypothetical protein
MAIVMRKACGRPSVRPSSPRPKNDSVGGMPFTVREPKICRPRNRKTLAVPNVMMMACTRPYAMSAPFTSPRTPPTATDSSTATGSEASESVSAFAVSTEHTMMAPPTETSIPAVTMTIVIPTPTRAIGAVATSIGCSEPAVRKAGVERPSTTQSTAMTPISTSS